MRYLRHAPAIARQLLITLAIPPIGHLLDTQLQSHQRTGASNPRALKHHLHNAICDVELNVITSACTAGRISCRISQTFSRMLNPPSALATIGSRELPLPSAPLADEYPQNPEHAPMSTRLQDYTNQPWSYLSASPITGSRLPRIATTSDRKRPSTNLGRACNATKEGERIFNR